MQSTNPIPTAILSLIHSCVRMLQELANSIILLIFSNSKATCDASYEVKIGPRYGLAK